MLALTIAIGPDVQRLRISGLSRNVSLDALFVLLRRCSQQLIERRIELLLGDVSPRHMSQLEPRTAQRDYIGANCDIYQENLCCSGDRLLKS